MTSESFAAFRQHAGKELHDLAEEHMKHDLQQSDRDLLKAAGQKFGTYAAVGSLVGLGVGLALAFRVRANRLRFFEAMRAREKPTHVQFADGRTEALPDITPLLRPSTLGDIATYTFFSAGGIFVFGELGFLFGSSSAMRSISSDPEAKKRIEAAYKNFKADALRQQADAIQSGQKESFL